MMTLSERLLAHAAMHDECRPHDDEQQGFADDLRAVVAEFEALRKERDRLREERDSQQRVCITVMQERDALAATVAFLRKERDALSELATMVCSGPTAVAVKSRNKDRHGVWGEWRINDLSLYYSKVASKNKLEDWPADEKHLVEFYEIESNANPSAILAARDARVKAEALREAAAEARWSGAVRLADKLYDTAETIEKEAGK